MLEPNGLDLFGVKLAHFIAGIAGGFVRAMMVKNTFLSGFTTTLVGSLTAAYMTTPVFQGVKYYFPWTDSPQLEYATSFMVGMLAMSFCEGMIKIGKQWARNPTLPEGGSK